MLEGEGNLKAGGGDPVRSFRCRRSRRLPVRPRPHPGESPVGYLVRVSEANGWCSPRRLWAAMGSIEASPARRMRQAVHLSEHDIALLHGPWPYFTGLAALLPSHLHREDMTNEVLRWCPQCLKDSHHHRSIWNLKLVGVCAEHGTLLLDTCPQCGAVQRFERAMLSRCACGQDLCRVPVTRAEASIVQLQRWVNCALAKMLEPAIAGQCLTPSQWFRLIRYLGAFSSNPRRRHPGQLNGLHLMENVEPLIRGTASVLADWPLGYHAFLERQRGAFAAATHINEAFGRYYRCLYRELADPCFDFLRVEFETFLREHWFGLLGRRNRRLSLMTIKAQRSQPLEKAARDAGVGKSVVRHLARQGKIEAVVVDHSSGRSTLAIRKQDVDSIRATAADHITILEASRFLGISRPRVRELIDAGVLTTHLQKPRSKASTWLLSRTSVEELSKLAAESLWSGNGDACECVELRTLLKTWCLRRGEFAELLGAISSGVLRAVGPSSELFSLGTLKLPVAPVREWLDGHRSKRDEWLSVDAAAGVLGLKQQVVYQLVARGLLVSVSRQDRRGSGRQVHRDAIAQFRQTYVSLAELAKGRGMAPRALLHQLSVAPVCGPMVDGARQYFYSRAEVSASG